MKKFLVFASIFLSSSFLSHASLADEMTVTTTGNASLYGFYDGTGAFGAGLAGKLTADGMQFMDDGSQFGGHLEAENPNKILAYLYYKSLFGELRAGQMALTDHGVEVPDAGDAVTVEFAETYFSDVDKSSTFGGLSLPAFSPVIGYASPEFGGFKLGLGSNFDMFDTALVGSFDTGQAKVRVGVGYNANYTNAGQGILTAGLGSNFTGFEVGGKISHDLSLASNATGGELGGKVNTGPMTFGLKYKVADINAIDKGVSSAGVNFNEGNMAVGAGFEYDNKAIATSTASLGAKYTLGQFSVGSWGEYKLEAATYAVNGGVDYQLTDNIAVGAGVSYDHASQVSGAAGLNVKF